MIMELDLRVGILTALHCIDQRFSVLQMTEP